IQPICNNGFLVDNGVVKDVSVLQDYNRTILRIGRELDKPVIAASDVHFLDPEDEQYRKILQAAKKFSDADRGCPIFFRTTNEMLAEFAYLGKEVAEEVVITNTRAIADQVEEIELLPKDLFPPKIEHSAEDLKALVYGKMHRIYGENPPKIVQDRVDVELNTILDHNYDVIYMSAQKLVQNSLENGYLVGSRGSVGSSLVAYMSGITEVNSLPPHYVCPQCCHSEFVLDGSYGCGADMPEKNCPDCGTPMNREGFDIPFETFLGFPGNEKTPDIDLNFSGEYQAKAHKYTETLFGSDHVFRAGTIGTLAEKTAYGYVKKYLEERGITATKAEENRLAQGLVGIKRTTGQHPGGLVVIPQDMDVTDFCPVQHPADDPNSDIITTHFEYHCMEANLLKLDELGHDDPTMIRMMEDLTGVDAQKISLSDPETMSIFTSPAALGLPDDDPIIGKTGTIGVPEFGTNFTRQMLVDTQPRQFDTLVRLSGFSHGTDVWAGNIHDLIVNGIATVNETVGCRDDIMLYLISKGMEPSLAFKTMEAVRKGKVKKSGEFPGDAEQQMRDLGVPDWYIESCRKIAYLFPKAHAVAYVMMAFRIAWFKVHEPLAFYSAYFYRRSQKGGFDAAMMTVGTDGVRRKIREMRGRSLTNNEEDLLVTLEAVYEFNMRGFEFAPIDLYQSDAIKFQVTEDGRLRPPFVSISGLGETAAWDLARCTEGGKRFISIQELGRACPKVSQSHLEQLKTLGALGDMPETSQLSFFEM
ncbi:MAG: PolC-type DNA polymerase III, partial [Candidatus Limivicinus sp.]|nr:PolC-type DNA polymerase III [Candidatus Limivicinus sp.]